MLLIDFKILFVALQFNILPRQRNYLIVFRLIFGSAKDTLEKDEKCMKKNIFKAGKYYVSIYCQLHHLFYTNSEGWDNKKRLLKKKTNQLVFVKRRKNSR